MTRRCETCEFRSVQECRRYPPVIPDSRVRKEWPHVDWSDWCGEYSPNQELLERKKLDEVRNLMELHRIQAAMREEHGP